LPETAGSTPWSWPRSAGRACPTRWTPCANATRSAWPTAAFHGALIDARLLAEVYLELRGGKERVLDLTSRRVRRTGRGLRRRRRPWRPAAPAGPRSTEAEHAAHRLPAATLKDRSLWQGYGMVADVEKASAG
jgi:DNA polymerase III epsilon subunit-like protein